ncbi:hypothetical protein ACLB2K_048327 [Fragaria x ananassa]
MCGVSKITCEVIIDAPKNKFLYITNGNAHHVSAEINIDGAFYGEDGSGGIGVVVRNDEGLGVAALARPFLHAHSVSNMEVEACQECLSPNIHQGWLDIDIESDYFLLVASLQIDGVDSLKIDRVLEDCKAYMYAFQYIQARHAYR